MEKRVIINNAGLAADVTPYGVIRVATFDDWSGNYVTTYLTRAEAIEAAKAILEWAEEVK